MSRPYISFGPGGPRWGVIMTQREAIRGMGAIAKVVVIAVVGFAILGIFTTNNVGEQAAAAIALVVVMFWLARQPPARPMTAAEQQAAFEAAKAEFDATAPPKFGRRSF